MFSQLQDLRCANLLGIERTLSMEQEIIVSIGIEFMRPYGWVDLVAVSDGKMRLPVGGIDASVTGEFSADAAFQKIFSLEINDFITGRF